MQLGVTDHIWSIGELVDTALSNEAPKPTVRPAGPFRVVVSLCGVGLAVRLGISAYR